VRKRSLRRSSLTCSLRYSEFGDEFVSKTKNILKRTLTRKEKRLIKEVDEERNY
jgi:hypothetical protein